MRKIDDETAARAELHAKIKREYDEVNEFVNIAIDQLLNMYHTNTVTKVWKGGYDRLIRLNAKRKHADGQ